MKILSPTRDCCWRWAGGGVVVPQDEMQLEEGVGSSILEWPRGQAGLVLLTHYRTFHLGRIFFLSMLDKLKRKGGFFGTIIARLFQALYKNDYFHILQFLCNRQKNSLVFENSSVELDNRPQTSRWISSSNKFPTKETQKEIGLGLSAGRLAFAAWPTACPPLAIFSKVPSVKTDDTVKIISRGHLAFLTRHHGVN